MPECFCELDHDQIAWLVPARDRFLHFHQGCVSSTLRKTCSWWQHGIFGRWMLGSQPLSLTHRPLACIFQDKRPPWHLGWRENAFSQLQKLHTAVLFVDARSGYSIISQILGKIIDTIQHSHLNWIRTRNNSWQTGIQDCSKMWVIHANEQQANWFNSPFLYEVRMDSKQRTEMQCISRSRSHCLFEPLVAGVALCRVLIVETSTCNKIAESLQGLRCHHVKGMLKSWCCDIWDVI